MSDDRAQLRARFTVPADRDLPPGRHFLHRENLMSQILNEPQGSQPGNGEPSRGRRPSPWRPPAWRPSARGLLATAAAVALVAGVGVTADEKLSAQPGVAGKPAATTVTAVLDRAASAAAARPAVQVGPNQVFYVKAKVTANYPLSKVIEPYGKIGPLPPPANPVTQGVEGWIAQSQAKETLWQTDGQSAFLGPRARVFVFGAPYIGDSLQTGKQRQASLLYPTYAYLRSLPTDPRRLLDLIEQQAPVVGDSGKRAGEFLIIEQLLATTVLPPQTAAALYRAAALIPGMTIVPDATDAIGRHGIGISIHEDIYKTDSEVWIFSKKTYQFLGVREGSVVPGPQHTTYTSVSAVLAHGVADRPGGTPRHLQPVR